MYFDDIIQRILDNPYSAFFYTPSYYTKSNSFIFTNPKEIIPIYNKNDMNNSLQLVDSYLDKGLEDNIWYNEERTKLATNRDLVIRTLKIAEALGRRPFTMKEARELLIRN